MTRAHTNPHALSALVERAVAGSAHPTYPSKSALASAGQTSPQHLNDLMQHRRLGMNPQVRELLAEALDVPAAAITCWCDRPGGVCRSGVAV